MEAHDYFPLACIADVACVESSTDSSRALPRAAAWNSHGHTCGDYPQKDPPEPQNSLRDQLTAQAARQAVDPVNLPCPPNLMKSN